MIKEFLITMAFVGQAAALAQPAATAQPAICGPYRVALYETGLLYFRNDAGEYVGIDRSVLEELARRTGCVFERFMDSRVRTWSALADGHLDMTVSGIETPQRQEFATFVPYIQNNRNYLILRSALALRVRSLQDFSADRSLRLGVVKGFVHGNALDRWINLLRVQGRVDDVADLEVLARIFAAGRVQAFLSQPLVWPPLLARNHLDGAVQEVDVAPQDSAVLGLVLSRTRVATADVDRIRAAMEEMRRDGTLERIYSRYVGPAMARALAGRTSGR